MLEIEELQKTIEETELSDEERAKMIVLGMVTSMKHKLIDLETKLIKELTSASR